MIFAFPSLLILKVVAFKIVAIIVFVLSLSMLESLLKVAFKKYFIISEEFPFAPKGVLFPLAHISVNFVKRVVALSASLSFYELPLVYITIVIGCSSESMRLRECPRAAVLLYVIVFNRLISVGSLTVGLPI